MIDIDETKKIADGKLRTIYVHPDDENKIVKIYKFKNPLERQRKAVWYKFVLPLVKFDCNKRDLVEHSKARKTGAIIAKHICPYYGLEPTSRGIGLVGERICNQDGKTSQNVASCVKAKGICKLRSAIDELFYLLAENHILFRDAHSGNILVKQNLDDFTLVIIEGLGEGNFVPYSTYSKMLNAKKLYRKKQRLLDFLMREIS